VPAITTPHWKRHRPFDDEHGAIMRRTDGGNISQLADFLRAANENSPT
jgi:hypothetical protein